MYRVNSKGQFNVPYNKKDDLQISTLYDEKNLAKISKYLNNYQIEIFNKNFKDIIGKAEADDFIFVDPPYDSDKTIFDNYDKVPFGKEGQKLLAQTLIEADKKGVKWIITNHNTNLINQLYQKFHKFLVPVNRQINSDSSNRTQATEEVIIYNYQLDDEIEVKIERFYKQLKSTAFVLKDYVSWKNIKEHLENLKFSCNTLNYLFSNNQNDFNEKFERCSENSSKVFSILPILISKRSENDFIYITKKSENDHFDPTSKESVKNFLWESGLVENLFLMNDKNAKDVYSYVFGVEVGMNTSNSQKNKVGTWMENKIKEILLKYKIAFRTHFSANFFKNNETKKCFDFSFEYQENHYLVEVNFFNTSGSKINAECERFIKLAKEVNKYKNKQFIWITDGKGLEKNKEQVRNAFKEINHFYNIVSFEEFLKKLTNC